LKGDMTLVGPRPAVPGEVVEYRARELRRLVVKPGITGLWQIGGRGDIDFEGQVRLDLEYIRSEGFWANLRILLLTVPAVLLGRGAY
jgi:lipopolysaccharide/colanic/teichoic acid biosynthesis glycosyltransferase